MCDTLDLFSKGKNKFVCTGYFSLPITFFVGPAVSVCIFVVLFGTDEGGK